MIDSRTAVTGTRPWASGSRGVAGVDGADAVVAVVVAAVAVAAVVETRSYRSTFQRAPTDRRRSGSPIVGFRKGCFRSSLEASLRGSSLTRRTCLSKR